MTLLLLLLWVQVCGQVLCEVLPPLQDMQVSEGSLRWTPDPQHADVTYSVQYRSFDNVWKDVTSCVQTSLASCNVTSTTAAAEEGCVRLRARAERAGLTSPWVEACSGRGDPSPSPCSPEFSLAARPGSLTVFLSRNHTLALEHGDHGKHRVYYGKEGQPLQIYGDYAASASIPELEEGQTYCARVQFILYGKPLGAPSCTQCAVIPKPSTKTGHAEIVVSVGVVFLMVCATITVAYVLIFKRGRIKKLLRPPYEIPHCVREPLPETVRGPLAISSPGEEQWDKISLIYRDDSEHRV